MKPAARNSQLKPDEPPAYGVARKGMTFNPPQASPRTSPGVHTCGAGKDGKRPYFQPACGIEQSAPNELTSNLAKTKHVPSKVPIPPHMATLREQTRRPHPRPMQNSNADPRTHHNGQGESQKSNTPTEPIQPDPARRREPGWPSHRRHRAAAARRLPGALGGQHERQRGLPTLRREPRDQRRGDADLHCGGIARPG